MNDVLRQRLVGALILVALGVLFWPIIFVQPTEKSTQPSAVPLPPGVSTKQLPTPDPSGLRASQEISAKVEEARRPVQLSEPRKVLVTKTETDTDPVSAKVNKSKAVAAKKSPVPAPQPRTGSPEPLKVDSDQVAIAWILQVASLSTAQKADALRMKLLDLGHKAYVKKVKSNGRDFFRVYIGPKFEKDRLERIKPEVDAAFAVSAKIVRYVP